MKGPGDHDATSMAAKGRAAAGEAARAGEVRITRRELERTEAALGEIEFRREVGGDLFFDYEPAPKARLAQLETGELSVAGRPLLRGVSVELRREDRIRIAGANGAGKTTLLQHLVAAAAIPPSRLLHLPQELTAADGARLLRRVRGLPGGEKGRVLSLVAVLGVDPDILLASAAPSPGEARKLGMAVGLGTRVWALALDEPTNHLDLPSRGTGGDHPRRPPRRGMHRHRLGAGRRADHRPLTRGRSTQPAATCAAWSPSSARWP
jgi:ATPase subunit of ABC transporter with duplicated ATPase domains